VLLALEDGWGVAVAAGVCEACGDPEAELEGPAVEVCEGDAVDWLGAGVGLLLGEPLFIMA